MVEVGVLSELYLYADDLKTFREIHDKDDVEQLQNDIDRLYDWTKYSFLRFNPDKCTAMRINPSKCDLNCFYNIDKVKLKVNEVEKDLGVYIDMNLSFDEHIKVKVKKANSLMGMIRRTFDYIDSDTFRLLFSSIVRPHLEYAAPVWNPHLQKHIDMIENVQRRATKLVPGLKNLTYKERLKQVKLPTLKYRRYRGDMLEMYKLTHSHYDNSAIKNFIQFNQNSHGHQFTVDKERCNLDVRKFSFKPRVTDQWNNLPDKVVNVESLNCFKNALDNLWKSSDIMYNADIDIQKITSERRVHYL